MMNKTMSESSFSNPRSLLWPFLIFLILAGVYISLALSYHNSMMFKPVWDIKLYLSIAEDGYNVRPCIPGKDYPMGDICGNVGWFPGWPLAVTAFSPGFNQIGILVLPYIFSIIGFIFFFKMVKRVAPEVSPRLATLALAAFPTAFYFLLGFPYALLLALMSIYLWLLYGQETRLTMILLPLLGLWISLCYPTAWLLAVVPLIKSWREYWANRRQHPVGRLVTSFALYTLPLMLGPLILSSYFYFKFDDFFLFLKLQENFQRSWEFPLVTIWNSLRHFRFSSPYFYMDIQHTQYLSNFVFLWYGLIFLLFYPYRIKVELVVFAVILYLFSPATGISFSSVWRHYLLILPAAMIIAASPRPRWFKLVYIALGAFLALWLYFPQFLKSYLV